MAKKTLIDRTGKSVRKRDVRNAEQKAMLGIPEDKMRAEVPLRYSKTKV